MFAHFAESVFWCDRLFVLSEKIKTFIYSLLSDLTTKMQNDICLFESLILLIFAKVLKALIIKSSNLSHK